MTSRWLCLLVGLGGLAGCGAGRSPSNAIETAACTAPLPAPPPAVTADYQAAVAAFVQSNCFAQWQADPQRRLTGSNVTEPNDGGVAYTVHDQIKAYYSPDMVAWMQANRPASGQAPPQVADIPDGAAVIAAVYPTPGEAPTWDPAVPTGYLVMIRQAGQRPSQPATGWFFSQIVTSPQNYGGTRVTTSTGDFALNLCAGCHASAVNNFTFAAAGNLNGAIAPPPYHPSFQTQSTSSLQAQLVPPANGQLRAPLGDPAAQEFLAFFNSAVPELRADPLPTVPAASVLAIPPESTDDEYQHPGPSTFVTSNQCQSCHDANALLSRQPQRQTGERDWASPQMSFKYASAGEAGPLDTFNLSQFGEWSVSIMALASRDPVFLSQAETERVLHPNVRPTSIDNFCYRCHGPMGQRQLHIDQGGDPTQSRSPLPTQANFDHLMIYATAGGCKDITTFPCNQPGAQSFNARYGGLARDGISCALCHHMGVPQGTPPTDPWEKFYGFGNAAIAKLESPVGIPYSFAGSFLYDLNTFVAPPADAVGSFVGKNPAQAQIWGHQQNFRNTQLATPDFLGEGEFCGGCHVVIAPEVPVNYPTIRNQAQIRGNVITPAYYPGTTTLCPPVPPPGPDGKYDPTQDPCVQQSYEQTTYLEWLASPSFGGSASGATCTGCHMPDANGTEMAIANIDGAGTTDGQGALPKVAWRAPDDALTVSSNARYPRHRLMAINLFVHEMFQQLPKLLGLAADDANVPPDAVKNLQNAEETILTHAPSTVKLSVCQAGIGQDCASVRSAPNTLTYQVAVTNLSGHRFPTGAGFRRGFLEVRLLDASNNTLWVSGAVNPQGAIVDQNGQVLPTELPPTGIKFAPSMIQPHFGTPIYPAITRQDQVQVYETRPLDEYGNLTTATTRLFGSAKDNRIPPAGWIPPVDCNGKKTAATAQAGTLVKGIDQYSASLITKPDDVAFTDPDYCTPNNLSPGTDFVLYQIPTTPALNATTVAKVSVVMHYQSTPPYFLRDRFLEGKAAAKLSGEGGAVGLGAATERLLYVASHLDTKIANTTAKPGPQRGQVSASWTMDIGSACLAKRGAGTCPTPPAAKSLKEQIDPNRRTHGGVK